MEYSYDNDNHRLYFLNKIISNLNSQFIDRFHGVTKRMLPLYYSEFEWRFNHRNCKSIMDKIKNYIMQSSIAARKMIRDSMDQYATARGLENAWVVRWSFPNKRILRNNLCLPACKQKNIATKLRDTA